MSLVEAIALGSLASALTHIPWEASDLMAAAREAPHSNVGAKNREVVEADAALNVAFWRVFSMVDPLGTARQNRNFAFFYGRLKSKIASEFTVSLDEASGPAKALARYLEVEARRVVNDRQRSPVAIDDRRALVDSCGGLPYCWYCGVRFSRAALDQFLGLGNFQPSTPYYVDFTAPRGMQRHDLRIEVDHLSAFSRGGADSLLNYRLACGWCNRHKSALAILNDAPSYPRIFRHPRLGDVFVPVPFWVVRVLGTRRRCDSPTCTVTIETEAMVVASYDQEGALVPGNLGVYCSKHDPMDSVRLIPSHLARGRDHKKK